MTGPFLEFKGFGFGLGMLYIFNDVSKCLGCDTPKGCGVVEHSWRTRNAIAMVFNGVLNGVGQGI